MIFHTGLFAALLAFAPLPAQAENCRFCQTGQGASPRGHGFSECRVNIPLPPGATKLAIQLKKGSRDLFAEPRVAIARDGKVIVGCGIFANADVLIACAEWGSIKKTTVLYRRNGRLDQAVASRLLEIPFTR